MRFSCFRVLPGRPSAEALVRRGGKIKYPRFDFLLSWQHSGQKLSKSVDVDVIASQSSVVF